MIRVVGSKDLTRIPLSKEEKTKEERQQGRAGEGRIIQEGDGP